MIGHNLATMFFNLPTLLTWARIIAIPLIVGVILSPDAGADANPSPRRCSLFSH